jgi:hypothetical protein
MRRMIPPDNLLPFLMRDGNSPMDLLQVLLQHFHGSVHPDGGHEMLYPGDPPHSLRVVFNERGEPTAAYACEALTPDAWSALIERIDQEFVVSTGASVNRQVYFSMTQVRGWWRYRDRFQIVPVPDAAPKAGFLDHPLLIEFRYQRAADHLLDGCRRAREVSKLALLLNALLVGRIRPLGGRSLGSPGFAWVLLPTETNCNELRIAHRQEAYFYDGMNEHADDFAPVANLPPIPEVGRDNYHNFNRRSTNYSIEVPSDLTDSFDRFFGLEPRAQDRFLNACYWLSQSNPKISTSMAFLAAIQAIETLVDRDVRDLTGCKGGKKGKRFGSTKLFAAFVEKYVLASQVGDDTRHLLYEIRSGLTHGYNPPFLMDTEIMGSMNPAGFEQSSYLSLALMSARVALHNWLHATR